MIMHFLCLGFEAGGQNTPSDFSPWVIIGNEASVLVATDRTSPFKRNPVALKVQSNCDGNGCPSTGVGVYNPGFWGMVCRNI
jgi:alpha-L-arabinofuranosidase